MKLTNRLDLPQPIVDAVRNDEYDSDGADISITGLIRPPRVAALEKKYNDEIIEDASDRIFSLLGQVIHGILERADKSGVSERRLSINVEGWKISGQMDRYDNGVLQDYKFISVYKIKDGVAEDFIQQMNMYAVLLRENGHPVTKLELVCILRDWSKMEASRDEFYPQAQVVTMDVPLWPDEIAKRYMRERVVLHQQARLSLPECSPQDRWEKPTVWAVMKRGQKRAVKLHTSEIEAQSHASADKSFSVVKRVGQSTRCLHYCRVAKFCDFYKSLKQAQEESEGVA